MRSSGSAVRAACLRCAANKSVSISRSIQVSAGRGASTSACAKRSPVSPLGGRRRAGAGPCGSVAGNAGCRSGPRNRLDAPLPPAGGLRRGFAPARDVRRGLRQSEDAEREHHLLQRRASVIAVLLHPEADPLAPRRQQAAALGDDTWSLQQDLVVRGCSRRRTPAFRAVDVAELGVAFEHVTVVAREHDDAPAGATGFEQFLDGPDLPRGPRDGHLLALHEVIVDRVDYDAHDPAAGIGDRFGHPAGNPRRPGFTEIALLKQHRRRGRRAGRAQPGVPGETVLLRRRIAGPELAAQQARTRHLGYRGQGGRPLPRAGGRCVPETTPP